MARGDTLAIVNTALANAAFLDANTLAGADTEGIVQAVDHGGAIEVYLYDGTASTLVLSYAGAGVEPVFLRCVKDGQRYRVKNVSGGNIHARLMGVVTK